MCIWPDVSISYALDRFGSSKKTTSSARDSGVEGSRAEVVDWAASCCSRGLLAVPTAATARMSAQATSAPVNTVLPLPIAIPLLLKKAAPISSFVLLHDWCEDSAVPGRSTDAQA